MTAKDSFLDSIKLCYEFQEDDSKYKALLGRLELKNKLSFGLIVTYTRDKFENVSSISKKKR